MSPARRRTTLAILALAVGGFAIGTTEFVTMGLLPQIAEGTGVDIATAGHYVSAYALGVVVGAPLIAVAAAKVAAQGPAHGADGLLRRRAPRHPRGRHATRPSWPRGSSPASRTVPSSASARSWRPPSCRTTAAPPRWRPSSAASGSRTSSGCRVATLLGQRFSWHLPYVLVGAIAALTVVAIAIFLPHQPPSGEESMRAEMQALRRVQVWLALLVGVVGFGGMFAMYSFITPTMTELAGLDERYIPWVLAAYGIGMVAGMVLSGRVANRVGVLKGIIGALGLIAVLLALFGWAAHTLWLAVVMVFVLGLLPSIVVPLLQTRLMDVAHEGQSLAAALNHSTLNTANALGAWLGSIVLAAGWGYGAPSLVGAGLAVLGVGVAVLSAVLERRSRAVAHGSDRQVDRAAVSAETTNA